MSRLDDLKYALASSGYSPERMKTIEQDVLNIAIGSVLSVERVADDVLNALSVMQGFQDSMEYILKAAPMAQVSLTTMAKAVRALAQTTPVPDMPIAATKPTERTPYYQRNKQQWWKS